MTQATPPSAEPVTQQPTPEDPAAAEPAPENRPAKKPKTDRPPRPPKAAGAKPKTEPRKKRGPARPHRRLDIETISSRIAKLEKRRLRAKEQLEDATRHVEGYQAERDFREQDAAAAALETKE